MLEAVSEIPSSWKSRLCWSVINHRRECRKQRGRAVLAQRRPACMLVKGTSAALRRRWMCVWYLLVNNITALERRRRVLTGGKQMQPEQREAPWLPLQLSSTGRWMHACCWSALNCLSAQSALTVGTQRVKKRTQKCVSWQRSGENRMRNILWLKVRRSSTFVLF